MRKVVLFIAMSLDGYIADAHGKVDWLNGQDENTKNSDVYPAFIQNIDTVIMGWNTYHQIITELSPTEWVYDGLTTYVITHRHMSSQSNCIFTTENPCYLVCTLKKEEGKNIWICGGANIVQQLMSKDLIDEYYISVIPTILGKGTRLFSALPDELRLRLMMTRDNDGIVALLYERRR